ncbi:protein ITPRID2-like isoform X2 [Micropterus dolomieu]|uniref:protein ITPRID2-like isoform X2 n=1 Tax=Micropterus dolomieu TaxID=147949 RepID=UPI001E8CBED9|nr:protein ITPRID2-like isoform X2 [Micropterus dolomieu]
MCGCSPQYSLDELEEMMLCLQQFRSVLSNMEEQLSEEQAAVYTSLSDQDREKVRDIMELRQKVKQEAGELEMQLNELAHHYDDSLKMGAQAERRGTPGAGCTNRALLSLVLISKRCTDCWTSSLCSALSSESFFLERVPPPAGQ